MKQNKEFVPCFICGRKCRHENRDLWLEIVGPNGKKIRACRKHKGVIEEYESQKRLGAVE